MKLKAEVDATASRTTTKRFQKGSYSCDYDMTGKELLTSFKRLAKILIFKDFYLASGAVLIA